MSAAPVSVTRTSFVRMFVLTVLCLIPFLAADAAEPAKPRFEMPSIPLPEPCDLGVIAFDWDFSAGPQGFYPVDCDDGGLSVWEHGPTTYIPDAPIRVWGTILQGDYLNSSGSGLVSPEFFVDSGSYLVDITHYVHTEYDYDGCNVLAGVWPEAQIIHPIGGYTTSAINISPSYYAFCVDEEPGWTGPDAVWRTDCFDLSAFLGQTIALECDFGSDESVTGPGWYLARVRVGGPPQELHACCMPDGSCQLVAAPACEEMGGAWHPELYSCDPNPCAPTHYLSIGGAYNPEPWNNYVGPEGATIDLRANLLRDEGAPPIVAVEFFISSDGGTTWDFLGLDSDGTDPLFDSYGDALPIGDGWMVYGTPVPIPIPDPEVHYRAIAYPEGGDPIILENSRVFDPAPPTLAETNIEDGTVVEEPYIEFVVDANGANLERIVVLLAPQEAEFVKGVPEISQHLHSEYHCAPTATAQCFRYFESQGDAELTGGLDDYELVGALGHLMETDPFVGTFLGPWVAGVNSWIWSHGNNYTVRLNWYFSWPYPTWDHRDWKFMRDELEKCQDVLVGVAWHGGGGHAMTLNSIINEPLPSGRIQIGFSDPWTADQTPAELDPMTGELSNVGGEGGPGAQMASSIIICPRQDDYTFGLPGELHLDFAPDEDPCAIPINIPGYGAWNVHIALVNDMDHQHSISTIIEYIAGSDAPDEQGVIPESFALLTCHPNPFPVETTIKCGLPHPSIVTIEVYDLAGRRIRTIHDGLLNAGFHHLTWDGSNDTGRDVSAGVYYVKMTAGGFEKVTRVARMR